MSVAFMQEELCCGQEIEKTYHQERVGSAGPKGVGGFLLLFCLLLTIFSPVAMLILVLNQGGFANLLTIPFVIYGFIVGCVLWSGSPSGRIVAKKFLLVRLCGLGGIQLVSLVAFLASMVMSHDQPTMELHKLVFDSLKGIFGEGIYFLLWWSYFQKSRRVINTFEDEDYQSSGKRRAASHNSKKSRNRKHRR